MNEAYQDAIKICDEYIGMCDSDLQLHYGTLDDMLKYLRPLHLEETNVLENYPEDSKVKLNNISFKSLIGEYRTTLLNSYI